MKKTSDIPFEPELGRRLRRTYVLDGEPVGLSHFIELLRKRSSATRNWKEFIDKVSEGKAVIGETKRKTKYTINLSHRENVHVACAYDALLTVLLRGDGQIKALCPHCDDEMDITISNHHLAQYTPSTIKFWWGTGPDDESTHPICDHLHFFPSDTHLSKWLEERSGELGFSLHLEKAARVLMPRAVY